MATVCFTNHTAEYGPGDVVDVSDDEATRLINAHMARKATAADKREAEEAEAVEAEKVEVKKK